MAGSIRTRLTVAVVAVVATVLVALALLLYVTARDAAWRQHDEALAQRARAIAAGAELDEDGYEVGMPAEPDAAAPAYLEVWKPDGSVLARSPSLRERDLARPSGAGLVFSDVTLPDGRAGRAVALAFVPRTDPGQAAAGELQLVLADGTERLVAQLASVRTWFVALGLAALAAVAGLTAWLLARGLRPLGKLARDLEQIDDTRLATRLGAADQPRELAVPVKKLEELLARLDAALVRERQFTADVSHELRTPLAGLRTTLEVTQLADRSTAEYRGAIADSLAIVAQLSAVIENLLALARIEAGQLEVATSEVHLGELVDACWAPHAKLAASRGLKFTNDVPADRTVRCDREQLRIVVGNLLANAAEYTEREGWITVTAGADGVVDVTDSGPPIAAGDLERMFDRLWRGDAARTATGVHCGIGLPLSRAICERLQLSLTATSSADGVRFRVG